MRWEQPIQQASLSDVGMRRQNNQDSLAVQVASDEEVWSRRGHLLVVADGMGGHAVGELASKIAVDTLPHTYLKSEGPIAEALKDAIEKANAAIFERGSHNREFERMGTTCSSLVLCSEGAICGHVGDSRVYRVRRGVIEQLTFDHSLQWELIRRGQMKPEDVFKNHPRNVITRSLGPEAEVNVDIEGPFEILPRDVYVLCSDGLTGHVQNHEIGIIAKELPPKDACRLLVNLANLRGGSDNTTVVIARIGAAKIDGQVVAEPEPAHEGGISWLTLGAFWVIASAAVGGISSLLLGNRNYGLTLIGLAIFALLGMIVIALKNRRQRYLVAEDPEHKPKVWKPYQSTSAKLTKKFMDQLIALESELHRMANEEGWDIAWEKHSAAEEAAKEGLAAKKPGQVLNAYGKMIDLFMTEIVARKRG